MVVRRLPYLDYRNCSFHFFLCRSCQGREGTPIRKHRLGCVHTRLGEASVSAIARGHAEMAGKRASDKADAHRVFGQEAGRSKTPCRAGLYARFSTHDQQKVSVISSKPCVRSVPVAEFQRLVFLHPERSCNSDARTGLLGLEGRNSVEG